MTFAGQAGANATLDGKGRAARFDTPTDLGFDAQGNLYVLERGPEATPVAHVRRIAPAGDVTTLFDATLDIAAIGSDVEDSFSKNIRGMAVVSSHRIALASGNGVVIRMLPWGVTRSLPLAEPFTRPTSSLPRAPPRTLLSARVW